MKTAVNKITEGAKVRDTIGRNQCPVLDISRMSAQDLVSIILNWQLTISSDNVEKVTNVILVNPDGANLLLKFRALVLSGVDSTLSEAMKSKVTFNVSTKQDKLVKDDKEKGDDLNDK